MNIPEHLWRHPTRAAIDRLSTMLRLENGPEMQDWEVMVADSARIEEFLKAYQDGALSDDDRFLLMEVILNSLEECGGGLCGDRRLAKTVEILDKNVDLHGFSIWYWADPETPIDESWTIAQHIRPILEKHYDHLDMK